MCIESMQNSSTEEKLRPAERKALFVRQGPRDWAQKCRGDFRIVDSAVLVSKESNLRKKSKVFSERLHFALYS